MEGAIGKWEVREEGSGNRAETKRELLRSFDVLIRWTATPEKWEKARERRSGKRDRKTQTNLVRVVNMI